MKCFQEEKWKRKSEATKDGEYRFKVRWEMGDGKWEMNVVVVVVVVVVTECGTRFDATTIVVRSRDL